MICEILELHMTNPRGLSNIFSIMMHRELIIAEQRRDHVVTAVSNREGSHITTHSPGRVLLSLLDRRDSWQASLSTCHHKYVSCSHTRSGCENLQAIVTHLTHTHE